MKEISIQAGLTVVADSQPQLEVPTRSASAAYPLDGETLTLRSQRARAEIQAVRNALEQTGWNRKRAARLLAISYRGLLYKIQRNNITRFPATNGDGKELTGQQEGESKARRVG
jgi:transcriptional regulator with GAF, ATPase, and Fis domain